MYIPSHFAMTDKENLFDLIERTAFGTLFTSGAQGFDANHIPFELTRTGGEFGSLQCHVARNNPVWQDIKSGDEVLVVFRAADAYISPNWFPSKQEHHKQVPTWNYLVAHAHGRVTIRDEEKFLRRNVALLTRRHEASQPEPWKMGQAPQDFLDSLIKAIVGLEIEITKLEGKAKLSQNKEVGDILSAGGALVANGQSVVGMAMHDVAAAQAKA